MNIHHEAIGKFPEIESFPGGLDVAISMYQERPSSALSAVIVTFGMHHYGLSFADDFDNIEQLIGAIQGFDQELQFS